MSAPQVKWEVISTRQSWSGDTPHPNAWAAEFGQGYLVVHASPQGHESLVYVPHAVSGLGERLDIDWEQHKPEQTREQVLREVADKLDITAQECLAADDPRSYEEYEHWINARNVVVMMLERPQGDAVRP